MRIRRLSSKILGTSAVPPSPPPLAALLPSAAGQLQSAFVCVLNQSPWDVLPCPPTPPPHSKLPPFDHKDDDEGMDDANGTGSDEESKTPPIILSLPAANSEMYREIAKKSKPPLGVVKKKKKVSQKKQGKGMNIRVKEEIRGDISATCNKTDGKQWKCKQPVSHPHSLCSYHRSQLRSYAKVGGGNTKKAAHKKKASVRSSAAAGSDSNSFYYYSNFGPWQGKRRSRENGGASANTEAAVEEVNKEMKSDDDDNVEGGTNEVAREVHAEDDDIADEDSDGEERSPQRRKRKPIKARSLKSFL